MYADFIMIVAKLCNIDLDEVVVDPKSELDKELLKASNFNTYPML